MDDALRKQIEDTLGQHKVVLFMKGSKQFPMCGFSGQVVQILNKLGVSYTTVNVLDDPAIRQGMKEFSDWPTFPQLYVEKKFVGGADIVRDMYASGELQKLVGASG
jgi:monothiol glutaredoxin